MGSWVIFGGELPWIHGMELSGGSYDSFYFWCYSWLFHEFMMSGGQTSCEFVVKRGLYMEFVVREFMVVPWVHGSGSHVNHVLALKFIQLLNQIRMVSIWNLWLKSSG